MSTKEQASGFYAPVGRHGRPGTVVRQVMNPVAAPYKIPLRQLKGEWMPPFRVRVNQLWARGA
jgi:hypothetical protein